ncbi:hypothetical protein BH23PAT1_BH23PAT1_0710 [soil metagenome]
MVKNNSSELIVATANTHASRMLDDTDGLKPIVDAGVGVLLLQEVLGKSRPETEDRLAHDGFNLVNFAGELGLAIAVNDEVASNYNIGAHEITRIHAPTHLESMAKRLKIVGSHRLRDRGILKTSLSNDTVESIIVATTHPIVFARFISRGKQIQAIQKYFLDVPGNPPAISESSDAPRLILGGDMNHYPSPRRVDLRMQAALGLQRVVLDRKSWPITGSRHEWMARIGKIATGSLEAFDAELDALLYRGVEEVSTTVVDVESDHRAIISTFEV